MAPARRPRRRSVALIRGAAGTDAVPGVSQRQLTARSQVVYEFHAYYAASGLYRGAHDGERPDSCSRICATKRRWSGQKLVQGCRWDQGRLKYDETSRGSSGRRSLKA